MHWNFRVGLSLHSCPLNLADFINHLDYIQISPNFFSWFRHLVDPYMIFNILVNCLTYSNNNPNV